MHYFPWPARFRLPGLGRVPVSPDFYVLPSLFHASEACPHLAVDDEPTVLFALKLLLKSEVREVVTEKNPELLLSLLR
jgi:hypothetical protein